MTRMIMVTQTKTEILGREVLLREKYFEFPFRNTEFTVYDTPSGKCPIDCG